MKINAIVALVFMTVISSCSSSTDFIPKVNDSNSKGADNNEVSIITYNIQTVFGKGDDKVSALTEYLDSEKYDFILMQEVFDESARHYFVDNLDSTFYNSKNFRE